MTAIEVAGGNHLNDIVVENEDVASECIKYLKKERIGVATFLPLNKIKPREFEDVDLLNKGGVIGLASDLIKFDKKYENAIKFIFGDTLVVENLDVAKDIGIGKVRMVTLDGDLIEKSGLMHGGYITKKLNILEEVKKYLKLKEEARKEIESLTKEVADIEEKIKKLAEIEERKSISELEKERIDVENRLKDLGERRKLVYEKRAKIQNELNKLNIQKARLEAELETAKIDVEQYGKVEYIDEKISILQQRIEEVWNELNSIGPVNFKAIEEYEKFKSEFESYRSKYEKILEEKKAVLEMIDKIEEKRREVFFSCLNEVKKYFNEVFMEIANGEASLELENPLDLDSGLIIWANPAGKKMLNIDAMSGGEKSLTALAFLLAIQKCKPAPFYIFDEIDAALDRENTIKVAETIKKFSKQAQFLVITHNETTVQYGDVVYGCTMVDGESKLIGLKMPS
jgi:chromosome segregation protein